MTTPKVPTIKRGGARFYVHPDTNRKAPGVTSVIGMLPKDFLKFWAAKVVAETAVENLQAVVGLAMNDPQGAVDYLKRAPMRNTGKAADTGTEVHELVERLFRGENLGRLHPDIKPFVQGAQEFLDEFEPEFLHLEQTVWSDTHGYAGSFDWAAVIKNDAGEEEVVIGDTKTTRSGVHGEVALQLAAYAHADYIVGADGAQVPLPEFTGGAVLHLRPEGAQVVPVTITDEVFEVFLSLLPVLDWNREGSKKVLGRPVWSTEFPVPAS